MQKSKRRTDTNLIDNNQNTGPTMDGELSSLEKLDIAILIIKPKKFVKGLCDSRDTWSEIRVKIIK